MHIHSAGAAFVSVAIKYFEHCPLFQSKPSRGTHYFSYPRHYFLKCSQNDFDSLAFSLIVEYLQKSLERGHVDESSIFFSPFNQRLGLIEEKRFPRLRLSLTITVKFSFFLKSDNIKRLLFFASAAVTWHGRCGCQGRESPTFGHFFRRENHGNVMQCPWCCLWAVVRVGCNKGEIRVTRFNDLGWSASYLTYLPSEENAIQAQQCRAWIPSESQMNFLRNMSFEFGEWTFHGFRELPPSFLVILTKFAVGRVIESSWTKQTCDEYLNEPSVGIGLMRL